MRCGHCGWPVEYDEENRLWNHVEHNEWNRYFCWNSAEYMDPDCAEPKIAVGPRCPECRLGMGTHNLRDPHCVVNREDAR